MGKKILVVVDMQNDFVTGALRNEDAVAIVQGVEAKVKDALERGDIVAFTRDTHNADYLETEEGKNLPVPHCIVGTQGWEVIPALRELEEAAGNTFCKETFPSGRLGTWIAEQIEADDTIEGIELVGLCTDICVISNAVIAKAFAPGLPIFVDAACCAGVTPASHDTALAAMEAFHIHVENKGREPWRK